MSHFTVAIIHKEKPQSLAELEAFLEFASNQPGTSGSDQRGIP